MKSSPTYWIFLEFFNNWAPNIAYTQIQNDLILILSDDLAYLPDFSY